jgi:hypothetical protein
MISVRAYAYSVMSGFSCELGPSWDQVETELGSSRDRVEIELGQSWDRVGTELGLGYFLLRLCAAESTAD